MNQRLSISVAMCTYNGEKYLREQLQSIAAQTRPPHELVVCDDGSTDATPEIIEEFSRTAAFPVRFIRNPENLGSTKNFEKAIGLCTGDLIALSDQDDIWLPEKLARQAEMMERDPELGGVFTDAELIDGSSKPMGKRLWKNIEFSPRERKRLRAGRATEVLLKRNRVTGATLMIRANKRRFVSPIPPSWVHDAWIGWMLAIYSKLAIIDEPLISYRIHSNQQLGVEAIASPQHGSLLKRLRIAKLEEPAKSLWDADQLRKLETRLLEMSTPLDQALLDALQAKIRFLLERGDTKHSRVVRVGRVLRDANKYRHYGHGARGVIWDIVVMFV